MQSLGLWDEPPGPAPWGDWKRPRGAVALGVTTPALALNSHRSWRPKDLVEVNDFEQRVRRHVDVVMWFADWESGRFDPRQADAVRRRGSLPEISWEPWDASIGPRRPQPRYTLASIIEGRHDRVIRRFAEAVREYRHPLRLRFAQEMNGRWYPWAEAFNGNRRGEFVRAWRHVRGVFDELGATNVDWIWAPVAGTLKRWQYPGDSQVDTIGVSGFNGGSKTFSRQWKEFRTAFGPTLDAIHHLAPRKSIVLPEVSSSEHGGDKARWIRRMFAELRRRPYIRALTWFDVSKEDDWRISSSPEAEKSFARGLKTLRRR